MMDKKQKDRFRQANKIAKLTPFSTPN